MGDRLVTQIADRAAAEPGQAVDRHDLEAAQFLFDQRQGIGSVLCSDCQHLIRLGADEAVAGQPLAAFDAFQQK